VCCVHEKDSAEVQKSKESFEDSNGDKKLRKGSICACMARLRFVELAEEMKQR
jgi:hypothetical protein